MCYSLIKRIASLHVYALFSDLAYCKFTLIHYSCTVLNNDQEQDIAMNVKAEPVVNKREQRLQRRREQDRACRQSESAEQQEERLRKRDRARRATQTIE